MTMPAAASLKDNHTSAVRNEKIIATFVGPRAIPCASSEPLPRVLPQVVFAAGKDSFEVLIRGFIGGLAVLPLVFDALPLEEHGWDRDRARVFHVRNVEGGMIWRLERG